MPRFELAQGRYLAPTPGGAYMATVGNESEPARRLLLALMADSTTPALTADSAKRWTGIGSDDAALEVAYRLQELALVQSYETARAARPGTLESLLPSLLAQLSGSGKALLADAQGFYLSTAGFPHETAEELSALSADLASMHERHAGLLRNNLGLAGRSWAVVDAAGNSQLGVWPLYVGSQRFALVLAGVPRLNQPAFVELVWALARRYASVHDTAPPSATSRAGMAS